MRRDVPLSYAKAGRPRRCVKVRRLSRAARSRSTRAPTRSSSPTCRIAWQTSRTCSTTLDRAEPQVEVEARIVQTTRDFAKAIGMQWGLNGRVDAGHRQHDRPRVPEQRHARWPSGRRRADRSPIDRLEHEPRTVVNLGVRRRDHRDRPGARRGQRRVQSRRRAVGARANRQGPRLSTPRVTTQNNIEAEVAQGVQIPIQVVANNTVTVTFKDAALTLRLPRRSPPPTPSS